jgi:hypothetical protein
MDTLEKMIRNQLNAQNIAYAESMGIRVKSVAVINHGRTCAGCPGRDDPKQCFENCAQRLPFAANDFWLE